MAILYVHKYINIIYFTGTWGWNYKDTHKRICTFHQNYWWQFKADFNHTCHHLFEYKGWIYEDSAPITRTIDDSSKQISTSRAATSLTKKELEAETTKILTSKFAPTTKPTDDSSKQTSTTHTANFPPATYLTAHGHRHLPICINFRTWRHKWFHWR